jgi:hypothetical protein
MTPKQFEVLQAAAAGGRSMAWFEDPDRIKTTNDLLRWGYINKVDLHKPDTGAEPKYYRVTDRGKNLWNRASTWEAARSIDLSGDRP